MTFGLALRTMGAQLQRVAHGAVRGHERHGGCRARHECRGMHLGGVNFCRTS